MIEKIYDINGVGHNVQGIGTLYDEENNSLSLGLEETGTDGAQTNGDVEVPNVIKAGGIKIGEILLDEKMLNSILSECGLLSNFSSVDSSATVDTSETTTEGVPARLVPWSNYYYRASGTKIKDAFFIRIACTNSAFENLVNYGRPFMGFSSAFTTFTCVGFSSDRVSHDYIAGLPYDTNYLWVRIPSKIAECSRYDFFVTNTKTLTANQQIYRTRCVNCTCTGDKIKRINYVYLEQGTLSSVTAPTNYDYSSIDYSPFDPNNPN